MLIYKCPDCGRTIEFPNLYRNEKITRNRICVRCEKKNKKKSTKKKKKQALFSYP